MRSAGMLLAAVWMMAACGIATAATEAPNDNDSSRKPRIGLRAGWDVTSPSMDHDDTGVYRNGSGFTAGAVVNIPIWRGLYVEPGAGVFYNTIKFKDMMNLPGSEHETGVATAHTSGSIRNWGIRIPLMAGWRLNFSPTLSLALYTGPQLNVGFTARQRWSETIGDVTTTTRRDLYASEGAGLHRTDVQWGFGVGINWGGHYHISVGGAAGLTNLMRGRFFDHGILHRNNFTIRLGWNF